MGLKIRSLARLPQDIDRSYFVYLLDYGWDEPFSRVLHANFDRMARFASDNDAVIITGFDGEEFTNDVFSYHHVNGQRADKLLPAILITTMHPHKFKETNRFNDGSAEWRRRERLIAQHDRMILAPLRDACNNETDVTDVIDKIVRDIRERKQLSDFSIGQALTAGTANALSDALILQPNFAGVGIDLKVLARFFRNGAKAVSSVFTKQKSS